MKEIIEKAVSGGYTDRTTENGFGHNIETYSLVVCNPLFWQALGKACGWRDALKLVAWQYYALQFHEINLTEGWNKAVEYLQEITKLTN